MTRSKAITRLRKERREAARALEAARDAWFDARRDIAATLELDLVAEHEARGDYRTAALDRLREQLDRFAVAQGQSRLSQDRERAIYMAELVDAVNRMIAGFDEARAARRDDAAALSGRVQDFLLHCRSVRSESSTEQAAFLAAFRTKLSEDAYRACTDDFS